MNDSELLEAYDKRGSESAFQTLVERRLGLVWSVAQRQVQDAALAEEIAQAVFLLLARKARQLSRRTDLGGWLFQTTRYVAARAMRSRQRRQAREQEAVVMHEISQPDPLWDRIAPELDEALEGLGRSDRQAILLRYYEGRSHREVAEALGVSEEAAKKRVQRGLERLRERLGSRAGSVSAATLGSLLTAHAVSAVPAGLAASVSGAVSGAGAAASSGVMLLARETLSAWRLAQLKLIGLIGGTAGVVTWLVLSQWPSTSTPNVPQQASFEVEPERMSEEVQVVPGPRPVAAAPASVSMNEGADVGQGALYLQVLTSGTDAPVAGVALALNIVTHAGEWVQRYDLRTDETGWATVPYPADAERLDVGVWSQGWAARYATFTPQREDPIPVLYTLRTQPVQDAIGGWVRDEQGRPVPGAKIGMHFSNSGDAASRERPRERDGFIRESVVAVTDAAGHWTCSVVPRTGHAGFGFRVEHPDFGETWVMGLRSSSDQVGREFTAEQEALWAGRLETVLKPGVVLTGRVLDESGQPVANAVLAHAPQSNKALEVRTDAEGRFGFPLQAASNFDFVVTADGFAPVYVLNKLEAGMAPLEITLKPGAVLRVRVEDEQGMPVPDADVILEQWGELRGKLDWRTRTGPDGRIVWAEAPPDVDLEVCSRKEGWCFTRDIKLKADGQEHVITLVPALEVNGLARDAITGLPVPELKAFPGHGNGSSSWERLDTRRGSQGQWKVEFTESRKPWRVRLEAEGYEPWISDPIESGFRGLMEARMQPVQASRSVFGVVVDADGRPAAGVQVALLSVEHNVTLGHRRFVGFEPGMVVTTDQEGRFDLAPAPGMHSLAAVSQAGFGQTRLRETGRPIRMELRPFGRIEGRVVLPYPPPAGAWMKLDDWAASQYSGHVHYDLEPFRVPVAADGSFVFDNVPPGVRDLFYSRHSGWQNSRHWVVSVPAGEGTQVTLRGSGRDVAGRVRDVTGQIRDWRQELVFVAIQPEQKRIPRPSGLSREALELWEVDYWQGASARDLLERNKSFMLALASDGGFQGEGIPAGAYHLVLTVRDRSLRVPVEVPAPDGAEAGPVDLGTFDLPARP